MTTDRLKTCLLAVLAASAAIQGINIEMLWRRIESLEPKPTNTATSGAEATSVVTSSTPSGEMKSRGLSAAAEPKGPARMP